MPSLRTEYREKRRKLLFSVMQRAVDILILEGQDLEKIPMNDFKLVGQFLENTEKALLRIKNFHAEDKNKNLI